MKLRRTFLALLISALAFSSVSLVSPSASADMTQERFTVPFTIPFGPPCADIPPGVTSISGTADFFVRTTTRVDSSGGVHLNINATAFGTATDDKGGVYSFNYANHFSIDIPAGGFPQPFRVTDHFNLNGPGKANHMHVGFVLSGVILDEFNADINVINVRGDAFNCDPI